MSDTAYTLTKSISRVSDRVSDRDFRKSHCAQVSQVG